MLIILWNFYKPINETLSLLLPLKALILIGSIALFTEVFRLAYFARINEASKYICIKDQYKEYRDNFVNGKRQYSKEKSRAYAYSDCK